MASLNVDIVISVAGETPGGAGDPVVLEYGDTNKLVTLSLGDTTGITSYSWSLIDQPPGTSCTLTNPTTATPTFTPDSGYAGTYLIQCVVNAGESFGRNGLAFTTQYRTLRKPGAGETREFDDNDGWTVSLNEVIDELDEVVASEDLLGNGVANTTALAAITQSERENMQARFVEAHDTFYWFDEGASVGGITPDDVDDGRWYPESQWTRDIVNGRLSPLTSTDMIVGPTGSASTPSFAFAGDFTTGLWRSGSGVYFSTAGVSRAYFDGNGLSFGTLLTTNGDISFVNRSSDPSSPVKGEMWYEGTTADRLKYYDGGTVYSLATTADISAEDFWDRAGTILSPNTAGDTLEIGSGTITNPGYAFESDPDTGTYLVGTGQIGFSCGSVQRIRFNENGISFGTLGTTYGDLRFTNRGSDPSAPLEAEIWYEGTSEVLRYRADGVTRTLATTADISAEDLWDRSGTTLIPSTSTDTLIVGNGAVGAPSVAFADDTTTGIYRAGSGVVGLVGAGSIVFLATQSACSVYRNGNMTQLYLRRTDNHTNNTVISRITGYGRNTVPEDVPYTNLDSYVTDNSVGNEDSEFRFTSQLAGTLTTGAYLGGYGTRVVDGSAAAPSLSFIGDTTTGLWRSGSGVYFSTAGVSRAYFDGNGLSFGTLLTTNGDISFVNRGSDPSSPVEAEMWYEGTTEVLRYRADGVTRTLATTADISAEDLWDRAGTVLSPNTAGDTLAIGIGAIGAPGYSFEGDTATGLYRNAAGSVAISSNGVLVGAVSAASTSFYRNAAGRNLSLYRTDTHGDTSALGYLNFYGKDAGSTTVLYSQIIGYCINDEVGNEDGEYRFASYLAGSPAIGAYIGGYGVRAIAGSVSAPSISFITDTDTGIYYYADGQTGFSSNGELAALINDGGLTVYSSTTNAAECELSTFRSDNHVAASLLFQHLIYGRNDVPETHRYGDWRFYSSDNADGSEDGYYSFWADLAGTAVNGLIIAGSGTLVPSGTAANPSRSFITDANTGLYRYGAEQVGVACNGSASAYFSTAGIRVADGTYTAPSLSFINETNTGFFLNTTNQVGLSINGVTVGITTAVGHNLYRSGGEPNLRLLRTDNHGSTRNIGLFRFTGTNLTPDPIDYCSIWGYAADATVGNEDGEFRFASYLAGSSTVGAYIGGYGTRVVDGSAAAPSLSFIGDTTTGLWRSGSGVYFSTAGVSRAYFDGNGLSFGTLLTTNGDISFVNRGSDPSSPVEAEMWYEGTTAKKIKFRDDSATQTLATESTITGTYNFYEEGAVGDVNQMTITNGVITAITVNT